MKKILALLGLFVAVIGVSQDEHAFVTLAKLDSKGFIGLCKKFLSEKSRVRFYPFQIELIKKLCGRGQSYIKRNISNMESLANDLTQLAAKYNALAAHNRYTEQQLQAITVQHNQVLGELRRLEAENATLQENYNQLFDLLQQLRGTIAELINLILNSRSTCSEDFDQLIKNLKELICGLNQNCEQNDTEQQCKNGDVNGDGVVDDADLLVVLFNMGSRQ